MNYNKVEYSKSSGKKEVVTVTDTIVTAGREKLKTGEKTFFVLDNIVASKRKWNIM